MKQVASRTGQAGEGNPALESEVFFVEYVDGLASDDERPTTWTIATTIILGHHTRVLDTHRKPEQSDRHASHTHASSAFDNCINLTFDLLIPGSMHAEPLP